MTIKHLVIAGGGPLGFRYLGALVKLEKESFWQRENIESIYGTSVGSIIGAMICLKYDWETLNKYVIERPWHDAFKINAQQLINSYYNKGIFDTKFSEIIFKPLLEAKNLSLNITLKELYEYSKIDLHIFTVDLNKFQIVELSHTLNPDLSLLQAIAMSSAVPGIFMPTIINKSCFIDGCVMCSFPINQCLRDHSNADEIFGIKSSYDMDCNVEITNENSLLDYVTSIAINAMNYIQKSVTTDAIDNTIVCCHFKNPINFTSIHESINNKELRQQWFTLGEADAEAFLSKRGSAL